ncbi:MAG TPA: ligase-associated DNA damage response endonuclease PdeM [Flavobacterium sp.]|jgi:DNA ligase-associated metallophosphoesterase
MVTKTIQINGQEFILHPSGSVFWTNKKMLLIADVHLGKVSHFRKAGFAVPADSISENFLQLDAVTEYFKPGIICFLGDLFHSDINNEWNLFNYWVLKSQAKIILIAGNHDVIPLQRYRDIGVEVYKEQVIDDFLLTHHPTDREGLFNFSGHIHPAVKLRGSGRQFLKLPCFFQKPDQMILPAFGKFTGTYQMIPTEHDCVYAVTKDEVIVVC